MSEERESGFAVAIPVEKSINSDGSASVLYEVVADCEQSAETLRELVGQEIGSKPERIAESSIKRSFMFPSRNWNVSYEPTGSGKNWAIPPEDPSRN